MKRFVSLRQNGVGPSKTYADAILPKGHDQDAVMAEAHAVLVVIDPLLDDRLIADAHLKRNPGFVSRKDFFPARRLQVFAFDITPPRPTGSTKE
jgi:hypothetical protein